LHDSEARTNLSWLIFHFTSTGHGDCTVAPKCITFVFVASTSTAPNEGEGEQTEPPALILRCAASRIALTRPLPFEMPRAGSDALE